MLSLGHIRVFAICLVFAAQATHAQVVQKWVHRYNGTANGDEFAAATVVDAAGNVVVTGSSKNSTEGSTNIYTAKYSGTDGSLIWSRIYDGGISDDSPSSLAVDAAGNVVITGSSYNAAINRDYYTAKYAAADGQVLWERRYDGPSNLDDVASKVVIDAAGDVIVTGSSYSVNVYARRNIYTVKYAGADGALVWERRHMDANDGESVSIGLAVDVVGNVVVTGYVANGAHSERLYNVKLATADGAVLWERHYNGPTDREVLPRSMRLDGAGNVIVTGESGDAYTAGDAWTAKYAAADGSLLWQRLYNGPANEQDTLKSVAVDAAGNVAVTGHSNNGQFSFTNDLFIAKYAAADGAVLWERRHGPFNSISEVAGIAVNGTGDVAITGMFEGSGSHFDYYTTMYSSVDGSRLWEQRYNGPANSYDFMREEGKLVLLPTGDVVVTGTSDNGSNVDIATVYYRAATPHESWRHTYFGNTADTGNAADSADPEHDGIPNLLEYAFGLQPTANSAMMLPQWQLSGQNLMTIFTQPVGTVGITYQAEWSTTLGPSDWHLISDTGIPPQHQFSTPTLGGGQIFVRLKVIKP